MTVMVVEIYDALRSAGADEGAARKAAEVLTRDERFDRIDRRFVETDARFARIEARLDLLTWMVGVVLALAGGVFTGTIVLLLRAIPAAGT
jgi:hypothetical protein